MGLSISWIAPSGMARSELLAAFGLAETEERALTSPVPSPAKFAAFELGGWAFVVSADHRFASRERVAAASQGGRAVGAYLEEHVMFSGAFGASEGSLLWSVQHDPNYGLEHLDIWGDPPPALGDIHRKLLDQQRSEGEAGEVDFVFDAPTELAATVCGFDPNVFDDEVDTTGLRVAQKDLMALRDQPLANAPATQRAEAGARKPGLFARLFGRG